MMIAHTVLIKAWKYVPGTTSKTPSESMIDVRADFQPRLKRLGAQN